jgi:DNA-binding winged helix-turn-helix (wHTH) protein/dipeptidyl aminopeptidase/acylaminoacyl peptidase
MNDGTQPTDGAIRVGDFVVDPRSGELRGEAGRQLLSAQPLNVLLALIERPGALVTRDELRLRLWPADTYVDFEHGLNAVVKRLRDALGDSADTPRYIETVPRRGYRLVAEVRPIDAAVEPATAPAPPAPPEAAAAAPETAPAAPASAAAGSLPARRRAAPLAVLTGLVVLALGAVAYFLGPWRQAEAAVDRPVQPVRLTFGPGLQTDAAWSPDGRRIVYAADRDGNFDLFTQSLDGGEPVRITSSPTNETQPAWSPDGQRIVFRSDGDGGGLYTISLDGGAIRRIAAGGYHPAWMPDGRDVAFAGGMMQTLYLVRADGDEPPRQILKEAMADGAWYSFAVHPDGRIGLLGIHLELRFGFYVSDREHRRLASVDKGTPLREELRFGPGRMVWNRAGDALFVEGLASGVPAVWRVPVDPVTQIWGTPVQLAMGPAGAEHVALSPDGTTLAFTNAQTNSRAWVFPFDVDAGAVLGDGRAVTDEDASVSGLHLSADAKSIFYLELRPGRGKSPGVQMRLDTGDTSVLYADGVSGPVPTPTGNGHAYLLYRVSASQSGTEEYALAWRSRDGRERLLSRWSAGALHPFDVRRDDQAVLATWTRRANTGPAPLVEWPIGSSAVAAPRRVLLETSDSQFWQGRYSPDGRWVTFVVLGMNGEGKLELGLAPSDVQGAKTWTRIVADHAWPDKPRWSPDGRTLYFLSRSAGDFFALWGVRVDPDRGVQAGAPFLIRTFDSPRWHIDPELGAMEMGVAKGLLALPMRSVKGSIWLTSKAGT